MKGSKGNGISRFGFSFRPSGGEKGSGVSKGSNLPTTAQSKIATTKTSGNKIERQPSNASQKLEANRFSQKTSSTNLHQVNSNVSNNNHNQSLLNNSNNQNHSINSTDNGVENKSPLKDVLNNSDKVKSKSIKSPKSAAGYASASSVGASSRTASRLQSPFRRRGSPSPVADRVAAAGVNASPAKRGCSPASNVGRIASSSPASTRKLASPLAGRRNMISRGGLVPKPYRPTPSSNIGANKPLLSVSGGGTRVETCKTSSTSSTVTLTRSLSSASSKLQSNNNVPIRTNPRASASNLPDAGNKLASSLPSAYQPFQQAIAAAAANGNNSSAANSNNSSLTNSDHSDSSSVGGIGKPSAPSSNIRSFATLREQARKDFKVENNDFKDNTEHNKSDVEIINGGKSAYSGETVHRSSKPDLQGMRASFFSNNNTSTTTTNSLSSRLVKPSSFTNSQADANKGNLSQMATTVANGNSEHLSVAITTVASTRSFAKSIATSNIGRLTAPQSVSTNLGFTSRLATLSSSGQEENNRHSQEAKVEVQENQTKKDENTTNGPSIDTLALIAGLGGLQANRQRSFKRFPPPSSSFSRQASAEQTADQEQSINNVPSGSEAQTNETSCLKEGATKRKWTRSIQARTSASSLTQAIAETKEDEVDATSKKPNALECLEQLKSSTRNVLDQHRPGIRTNPKVSLRRQVLPSIPQEDSEHPTPELLVPETADQRKSATSELLLRISGTPDLMKSSTESSVTSNQSDDVKTVISNTMVSSTDDIDLDDELIVIETEENSSVPEVKLQSGGHTTIMTGNLPHNQTTAMKLMNTSFHESSPNETESDSGVFTSSYSKYSLDSLQDDKDQDNRTKPQIQKSIVKMCDIQPQVPAQVTSSGKTADKSADSLYHQPATQPIMEEEDQGLEPELISFNQAAAGLEAANSGVNTGLCSLTASMEASMTTSSTSSSSRFMVASTSNFSDMDEVGSSRETSPLQLLDDLLKKNEERNDERRAISTGTVKNNCKKFESKCHKEMPAKPTKSDMEKSSKSEVEKSTKSESSDNTTSDINNTTECNSSNTSTAASEVATTNVNVPKESQVNNAEMVKSITSSTSMSSSITEATQSVSEAVGTDKSTSGHTKSPSSFSDNDKDFLIDDDYKDQPQLTFYDQEDSIEESIFSTLDSLLAGKDDSNAKEYKPKETGTNYSGDKVIPGTASSISGTASGIPGKVLMKAHDSPTSSPRRHVQHHQNLRKFSLTNQIRDQVTNDDSERSRLRSRADTLSSLASDDCMMDFECRISDDEEGEDEKSEDKRSMSPRMRETEHDSCGAATTSSINNNHSKGHSCSSQQDSQCTTALYGGDYNGKPCLSRSSSLTSDEGVIIDRSTHNTLTQDTLEIKFLLLKLRRVLQEVEGVDGGVPTKLLESVLLPDSDNSIEEENMDLKRQVTLLQQQVEERDRRLRQLELEAMHRSSHTPTRSNNCLTKNAAIQTDRVRPVSCGSIAQDGLIREENN